MNSKIKRELNAIADKFVKESWSEFAEMQKRKYYPSFAGMMPMIRIFPGGLQFDLQLPRKK